MTITGAVSAINTLLSSGLCNITNQINGIAEPILVKEDEGDDEKYIPAIIDNNGECIYPFVEDEYKLGLYHRLLGKTYTHTSNGGFGDGKKTLCVSDLNMIIWGFKSSTLNQEDFEQYVYSKIAGSVSIQSVNFDRNNIFASEFKGVKFFLPPEVFLISIKYKVQFEMKASCLEINEIFNCTK
ncbi:MAG: hypothetical protein JXQ69_03755 [Paludibacteraceae bacterium]|nr:hypothetical protein [Paludibacteraceae bacterium]